MPGTYTVGNISLRISHDGFLDAKVVIFQKTIKRLEINGEPVYVKLKGDVDEWQTMVENVLTPMYVSLKANPSFTFSKLTTHDYDHPAFWKSTLVKTSGRFRVIYCNLIMFTCCEQCITSVFIYF